MLDGLPSYNKSYEIESPSASHIIYIYKFIKISINLKGHNLNLAKCSSASSNGNGLPTNDTFLV